jgi:hypothetical protein
MHNYHRSERRIAILRIKYPVDKFFVEAAYFARKKKLDGAKITVKESCGPNHIDFCDELGSWGFPSDWIEEIKKPMTPQEAIEKDYINDPGEDIYKAYMLGWKRALENEKLEYAPKQTFEQCVEEWLNDKGIISRYEIFELGWKAYAKNRGYDD